MPRKIQKTKTDSNKLYHCMRNLKIWRKKSNKSKIKIKRSSKRYIGSATLKRKIPKPSMIILLPSSIMRRKRTNPKYHRRVASPTIRATSPIRASISSGRKKTKSSKGTPYRVINILLALGKVCSVKACSIPEISQESCRRSIHKWEIPSWKIIVSTRRSYWTISMSRSSNRWPSSKGSRCSNPNRHTTT